MLCCCLQITDHHNIQIGDMVMLPCDNPPSECPPHSRCQLLPPAAGGAANQSNRNPEQPVCCSCQHRGKRSAGGPPSTLPACCLITRTACLLARAERDRCYYTVRPGDSMWAISEVSSCRA